MISYFQLTILIHFQFLFLNYIYIIKYLIFFFLYILTLFKTNKLNFDILFRFYSIKFKIIWYYCKIIIYLKNISSKPNYLENSSSLKLLILSILFTKIKMQASNNYDSLITFCNSYKATYTLSYSLPSNINTTP